MLYELFFLLFALAPSIQAIQVANLNVSKNVATQYGCGTTCYKHFQAGLAADAAAYGAIYDASFYQTAHNFSTSNPGDALKLEPINATLLTNIPQGTTAYRFQYVSRDLSGEKVPTTGFIAFPYANRANSHKYRAVAYAHGTSGVFKGCAPSARPDLYEYDSWAHLVERGYAVIATDYTGLGNDHSHHQYVASPAQANDLYYSVAAAQKLFSHVLTPEWMSIGHSQGGGAVWALAESPLLKQNPLCLGDYLGTVAHAPGVRVKDMALLAVEAALNASSSPSDIASARGVLGEFGWIVLGLRSILPDDPQTWLKPTFRKRLELATLTQACYSSMMALVEDLDVTEVADLSDPGLFRALETMQNLTARGEAKSEQPVLVLQGLSDVSVLPEMVVASYRASCRFGNEAHLQLYPGIDHDPVIPVSAPYFLQWMDDRFNAVNTTGKCSNQTVEPFDSVYMYASEGSD